MFALGDKVIGDPGLATFAAFGSFAMLLLVDFGGPMRERLQAQASLAIVGAVFVCVGTLASPTSLWLATAAMAIVGFCVLFAGVVSSVLAAASTSLLLAFILPVTLSGPPSEIPARLAGWGLASVASFAAVALLWPAPAREPLRGARHQRLPGAGRHGCRPTWNSSWAVGDREDLPASPGRPSRRRPQRLRRCTRRSWPRRTDRPGLSSSARTIVRLVDELNWLDAILATIRRAEPARCRSITRHAL